MPEDIANLVAFVYSAKTVVNETTGIRGNWINYLMLY
jgi:hypothetical protein